MIKSHDKCTNKTSFIMHPVQSVTSQKANNHRSPTMPPAKLMALGRLATSFKDTQGLCFFPSLASRLWGPVQRRVAKMTLINAIPVFPSILKQPGEFTTQKLQFKWWISDKWIWPHFMTSRAILQWHILTTSLEAYLRYTMKKMQTYLSRFDVGTKKLDHEMIDHNTK